VVECLTLIAILEKHHARAKGDAVAAALMLDETVRDQVLEAVLVAPLTRGATATALAQISVSPHAMKRLVGKGVDWSWHDGEDDAALPLLSAIQRADRDFVRALLDAGAPANVHFKDGTSPLGAAIDGAASGGSEYARIVELLVARGVDVNRRLPDGRTPLFAAAESGELRVVNALLERGARVNDIVLDDTALDAAEQNGHQPAARVLHAHGGRRARRATSGMHDEP
jgi:ankyrin repeat protein